MKALMSNNEVIHSDKAGIVKYASDNNLTWVDVTDDVNYLSSEEDDGLEQLKEEDEQDIFLEQIENEI